MEIHFYDCQISVPADVGSIVVGWIRFGRSTAMLIRYIPHKWGCSGRHYLKEDIAFLYTHLAVTHLK